MSKEKDSIFRTLSAAFLVAGTCIGAGMLALPDVTAIAGFFPSFLVMFVCFVAMTLTSLLLVEASLWMKEGAHFLSISKALLGKGGQIVSFFLFLFISYASLIAYTAEGGSLLHDFFFFLFGIHLGKAVGCLIFLLFFGFIVDFGTKTVGKINTILFLAMIIAYLMIIGGGIKTIHLEKILETRFSAAFYTIPFLLTSFSIQTMVPSLTPYLERNGKKIALAIIFGMFLAFLVYTIWLLTVLGSIPFHGADGLKEAFLRGDRATKFFYDYVPMWVATLAEFFAFFAMATSFLGMGLGLFDFLADGLKVEKKGKGKILIAFLIVVPTYLIAVAFERIFLVAIDLSGGYGDTILSGILPVLFIWQGRYRLGYSGSFSLPGGKKMLIFLFLFFLSCLLLELSIHTKWICSLVEYCQAIIEITPREVGI